MHLSDIFHKKLCADSVYMFCDGRLKVGSLVLVNLISLGKLVNHGYYRW